MDDEKFNCRVINKRSKLIENEKTKIFISCGFAVGVTWAEHQEAFTKAQRRLNQVQVDLFVPACLPTILQPLLIV